MIEPVDRLDDSRISDYAHVGDPAWLRRQGLFVAEGRLVVARLLESRGFTTRSLFVTPAALEALGALAEAAACPAYVADQRTLNAITGFDFHRGCLALAERPQEAISLGAFAQARLLVALEGVGNPDNVGGVFRNALAFRAEGVLLDPSSGDPLYRKAIRTSMAAVLRVPFARLDPWPGALRDFRRRGFQIVALTPERSAATLATYAAETATTPKILLLGAEGQGLTPAAFDAADVRVRIPIAPEADSLNVTVAAGIALAFLAGPG